MPDEFYGAFEFQKISDKLSLVVLQISPSRYARTSTSELILKTGLDHRVYESWV